MSFYETLYIVDPNLENNSLETTMSEIGTELEKTKSKIINHRVWGKKRLAYPIERQKYGSYILMQFESGDQDKMVDYDIWMRLNNSVLRHMTVLLDQKPELYVEEIKPKIEKSESESEKEKSSNSNDTESVEIEPEKEKSNDEDSSMDNEKTLESKEAE
jgi:small subunit ribosomal protein S6